MGRRCWLLLVLGAALLFVTCSPRGAADRGATDRVRAASGRVGSAWAGLESAWAEWERQPSRPTAMAQVRIRIAEVNRAESAYRETIVEALRRLEGR